MSRHQATRLIEIDTDTTIWTCDAPECDSKVEIPKGHDRYPGLAPNGWIGVHVFGDDPAATGDRWEFCSESCAGDFLSAPRE